MSIRFFNHLLFERLCTQLRRRGACGLGYSRRGVCGQTLPPKGDNSTQAEKQRLASASGGQLGLPLPLFRRTAALQQQQTECKRREWLSPQQQLRSKVNNRLFNSPNPADLCTTSPAARDYCQGNSPAKQLDLSGLSSRFLVYASVEVKSLRQQVQC